MAFEIWTANTPAGQVEWMPITPYVIGNSLATYLLWSDLLSYDEDVPVTPSGPFLATDPSNPYLIRYLIEKRWLKANFSDAKAVEAPKAQYSCFACRD